MIKKLAKKFLILISIMVITGLSLSGISFSQNEKDLTILYSGDMKGNIIPVTK